MQNYVFLLKNQLYYEIFYVIQHTFSPKKIRETGKYYSVPLKSDIVLDYYDAIFTVSFILPLSRKI